MSSDDVKQPDPPDEPTVAGQPTKKLTLFEQMIKKTAKVLRQSR
jgi:hypothetical protein